MTTDIANIEIEKRPLVLFSGGMDSTYLVQWFLQFGDVDTMYVQANVHPLKVEKETQARKKLFALFEKHYKYKVIQDHQVNLDNVYNRDAGFAVQPISWLTAAVSLFDVDKHSGLAVGYLLGDQAPAYRENLDGFWGHAWRLLRGRSGNIPPLWFSLLDSHSTKRDVLNRIDKRLVTSTWVCEEPTHQGEHAHKRIIACGRCKPCRLLKHTVADWEQDNTASYMKEVIKELNPDIFPNTEVQLK